MVLRNIEYDSLSFFNGDRYYNYYSLKSSITRNAV